MRRAKWVLIFALAGCSSNSDSDNKKSEAADAAQTTDAAVDSGSPQLDMSSPRDLGPQPDLSDGERPAVRTIAADCPMKDGGGGDLWDGWANLQHPLVIEAVVGDTTEPIFGQVWREGSTDQPGKAEGWEAELMVGPLGANPEEQPGCFRALAADYNVDEGNNDEYWVRVAAEQAGLFGLYYRYRPPGGQWRYGDLNGSDDGVSNENAAVLAVDDPAGLSELRVVTLNLRCRTDDWAGRMPAVVDALVASEPHVVGFQEDCAPVGGQPQSYEVLAALASRLDRGYEVFRLTTHQANHPEGTFDEGVALFSSLPIEAHFTVDLPAANFARVAQVMDVRLGSGKLLRVVNTHLDFGAANDNVRDQSAMLLGQQKTDTPIVVTGDFNAEPNSPAYGTMSTAFDDVWVVANPGDAGLTMPASNPTRRIDYIWSSGLTVGSAALIGEAPLISDHLGISATLAF